MVFGFIPECRSASLRKQRSASPESSTERGSPPDAAQTTSHHRVLEAGCSMARLKQCYAGLKKGGCFNSHSPQLPRAFVRFNDLDLVIIAHFHRDGAVG